MFIDGCLSYVRPELRRETMMTAGETRPPRRLDRVSPDGRSAHG
jgi:hypothetical protein